MAGTTFLKGVWGDRSLPPIKPLFNFYRSLSRVRIILGYQCARINKKTN